MSVFETSRLAIIHFFTYFLGKNKAALRNFERFGTGVVTLVLVFEKRSGSFRVDLAGKSIWVVNYLSWMEKGLMSMRLNDKVWKAMFYSIGFFPYITFYKLYLF